MRYMKYLCNQNKYLKLIKASSQILGQKKIAGSQHVFKINTESNILNM